MIDGLKIYQICIIKGFPIYVDDNPFYDVSLDPVIYIMMKINTINLSAYRDLRQFRDTKITVALLKSMSANWPVLISCQILSVRQDI